AGVQARELARPLDARVPVRSGLPTTADPRASRFRRTNWGSNEWGESIRAALTEDWLDRADGEIDVVDEIGYGVLGPALVGFSQYLGRRTASLGIDRLLFLAREGEILQRAYRAYFGDEAVQNEYLVISTRMLGLAELTDPESEASLRFLTKTSAPLRPI